MAYSRINLAEREKIFKLLSEKKSLRKIANEVKRSVSTISEEIRRNGMNKETYSPAFANSH